ncbi:MAG TPA: terminase family protein [Rhizomicrobium sp.]|nr:terminase family protein [Rhizomicrobium sp.]
MNAASIASLPAAQCRQFLKSLNDEEAAYLCRDWRTWARPEQVDPEDAWRTWLFLGGRGAGKTRAGAEWIAEGLRENRMRRIALIGATFRDARAVMIEGESGLLKVTEGASFEPSNQRVLWPGGEIATVLSAEEPDAIRGHQFDAAWGDEFCKWQDPDAVLDMVRMALRIGDRPRMMLTTTPRNIAALKALIAAPGTVVTRGATRDNVANLAPGFVEDLQARYGGTRLGRQELDAEIVEDVEGALFQRGWIETGRVRAAPGLVRIVVAVDPPASQHGCECGIVVAGMAEDGAAYVLADRSAGGLTPQGWARRVADAYEDFEGDCVVAEANQGGDMVRAVLTDEMAAMPLKLVHATRGKTVRAEPVAQRYETGRVHHAGVFPELEDQLCSYDGQGKSPDRLDALVWALTELFGKKRAAPKVRAL